VIAELASSRFTLSATALLCVAEADGLPAAHEELERELSALDEACSRFREDSELVRVNDAAGRGPVGVSPLLFEAIQVALAAAEETGGLVDPTVGRTLRLAGYDRRFATVKLRDGSTFRPSFAQVPGWRQVELDPMRRTVALAKDVELDLGATAKALAADRIARSSAQVSGTGVLVSLGGDVAVDGPVPDGGWPIRVADDHAADPDQPGPTVALSAGGLATSGTAVRRWLAGEVALHAARDIRPLDLLVGGEPHLAALQPLDVVGRRKAAVVLGEEAPWLAARGLPARLVREAGEVTRVGGWPEDAA
jgi:thiamine biosynthesis lipoprotein